MSSQTKQSKSSHANRLSDTRITGGKGKIADLQESIVSWRGLVQHYQQQADPAEYEKAVATQDAVITAAEHRKQELAEAHAAAPGMVVKYGRMIEDARRRLSLETNATTVIKMQQLQRQAEAMQRIIAEDPRIKDNPEARAALAQLMRAVSPAE